MNMREILMLICPGAACLIGASIILGMFVVGLGSNVGHRIETFLEGEQWPR